MWILRSPDEIAKWAATTEREARSHGRFIAGIVLVIVPLLLAGGWFVSFSAGVAVHQDVGGTFWLRLPFFVILAIPFAWFAYRYERKKKLTSETRRTICPQCDTASDANEGRDCSCGGRFVLLSSMKWVEDENRAP
jgi:hypothetical protein